MEAVFAMAHHQDMLKDKYFNLLLENVVYKLLTISLQLYHQFCLRLPQQ